MTIGIPSPVPVTFVGEKRVSRANGSKFLEEFLGHTNSCILNHKLIPALGILVFNLPQAYGDRCSSLAVFQRIGDQIVDDLV